MLVFVCNAYTFTCSVSMYVECNSMGLHGHKDVHNRYVYTYLRIYFIFLERERERESLLTHDMSWKNGMVIGDRIVFVVCNLSFNKTEKQHPSPTIFDDFWKSPTVDGGNPAPVDKQFIPLFSRFYTSLVVVWDF